MSIDAGTKFNDAVESTAVIGDLRANVEDLKADVGEIKADVKHIRHQMDRYAGAMVVVGSLVSIAVSFVVALIK